MTAFRAGRGFFLGPAFAEMTTWSMASECCSDASGTQRFPVRHLDVHDEQVFFELPARSDEPALPVDDHALPVEDQFVLPADGVGVGNDRRCSVSPVRTSICLPFPPLALMVRRRVDVDDHLGPGQRLGSGRAFANQMSSQMFTPIFTSLSVMRG